MFNLFVDGVTSFACYGKVISFAPLFLEREVSGWKQVLAQQIGIEMFLVLLKLLQS